jgi:hypothetical protein
MPGVTQEAAPEHHQFTYLKPQPKPALKPVVRPKAWFRRRWREIVMLVACSGLVALVWFVVNLR